jgi:hypothetical protein
MTSISTQKYNRTQVIALSFVHPQRIDEFRSSVTRERTV